MEKKLMPRKVASADKIEQLVAELDRLAWDIEDDAIRSDMLSLIEDICKDREICPQCYSKINEVWFDDGLHRKCECKDKIISEYIEEAV